MRPGYWYGNGVMPAVRQEKGILGAIYVIPEEHPIHFTHVYWPGVKFDESRIEDHWLFGRKGSGYLGVWCSEMMKAHQDQIFDCEYRSYGDEVAYCCFCGSEKEYGSLEQFIKQCQERTPEYQNRTLRAGEFQMTCELCKDKTQYI